MARMTDASNARLECSVENHKSQFRLICIPNAGGEPSAYRSWGDDLGKEIKVFAVHVPRSMERRHELPVRCWSELIRQVTDAILALDTDLPFFLFGHSFGGLIAFEATRELRHRCSSQPVALFVSGRPAPSLGAVYPLNQLGDDDLHRELINIDPEIQAPLRTEAVFQELLPRLRADLKVCDSYVYKQEPLLTVPIVAFAGRSDCVGTLERVSAWRHETLAPFVCHVFDGGHFFLKSAWPLFVNTLRAELHRLASAAPKNVT